LIKFSSTPKPIKTIQEEVTSFFSDFYNASKDDKLSEIKKDIDKISEYNKAVSSYILKCSSYITKVSGLINKIRSDIKSIIDELTTSELQKIKAKIEEKIKVVTDLIDSIIQEIQKNPSVSLSDKQQKMIDVLESLKKFMVLDNTDKPTTINLLYVLLSNIEKSFELIPTVSQFSSDMNTYIKTTIDEKINIILQDLLKFIFTIETKFNEILEKKDDTTSSSSSSILLSSETGRIKPVFAKFVNDLQQYFKINGGKDTLFILLSDFIKGSFDKVQQATNESIKKISSDEIPEPPFDPSIYTIADASSSPGVGGGGGDGNGNASTLATLVVSNKSQKNRNNGKVKGNGKGKGKGKGGKPNVTKKNNRR
jgi:hypothetical protein